MFKSEPTTISQNDFVIDPGSIDAAPSRPRLSLFTTGLFIAIAILQLLDWHSTFRALGKGAGEANPYILSLAKIVGLMPAVSLFKIIALLLTALYFSASRKHQFKKVLSVPLGIIAFFYSIVVYNNYLL